MSAIGFRSVSDGGFVRMALCNLMPRRSWRAIGLSGAVVVL